MEKELYSFNKSIYFIFFCSNNFQQSSHGIESPNMQWETARCEDNLRIYNNTHGYGSQVKNRINKSIKANT